MIVSRNYDADIFIQILQSVESDGFTLSHVEAFLQIRFILMRFFGDHHVV